MKVHYLVISTSMRTSPNSKSVLVDCLMIKFFDHNDLFACTNIEDLVVGPNRCLCKKNSAKKIEPCRRFLTLSRGSNHKTRKLMKEVAPLDFLRSGNTDALDSGLTPSFFLFKSYFA